MQMEAKQCKKYFKALIGSITCNWMDILILELCGDLWQMWAILGCNNLQIYLTLDIVCSRKKS